MKANSLKNKLKSNRGASLSISLLLFLVCAVLGSIILRSATIASGRLVGLAKADSRYYSVNSAADLLTEMLDGQTVHIRRGKLTTTTYTHVYTTDAYGNTELTRTDIGTPEYRGPLYITTQDTDSTNIINKEAAENLFFSGTGSLSSDSTLLTAAAYRLLFDFSEAQAISSPNALTVWNNTTPAGGSTQVLETRSYSLQHANSDYDFMGVQVTQQLKGDGSITLVISSTDDPDDVYEVRLTFSPNIKNKTARKTIENSGDFVVSAEDPNVGTIEETESEYKYKYTSITWTLTDVKKAGL